MKPRTYTIGQAERRVAELLDRYPSSPFQWIVDNGRAIKYVEDEMVKVRLDMEQSRKRVSNRAVARHRLKMLKKLKWGVAVLRPPRENAFRIYLVLLLRDEPIQILRPFSDLYPITEGEEEEVYMCARENAKFITKRIAQSGTGKYPIKIYSANPAEYIEPAYQLDYEYFIEISRRQNN